ncbi:hypothetical protein C8J57DRAFT_1215285 [Mycena rebaudengoi]|nr:hypothetical protein C8J57DRAFT_1215285 [Mycena rebaudengoi]
MTQISLSFVSCLLVSFASLSFPLAVSPVYLAQRPSGWCQLAPSLLALLGGAGSARDSDWGNGLLITCQREPRLDWIWLWRFCDAPGQWNLQVTHWSRGWPRGGSGRMVDNGRF